MTVALLPYLLLMLGSILVAGFSQILLKKAARRSYARPLEQYLNARVIIAYLLFFGSTVFSVLAYRGLPLSVTPIFNALSQLLVLGLSCWLLGEQPTRKRLIGLGIIIIGIVLFSM